MYHEMFGIPKTIVETPKPEPVQPVQPVATQPPKDVSKTEEPKLSKA